LIGLKFLWRRDAAIAVVFALLSATLSIAVLAQSGTLFFYQNFTPEVVYAACGLGFQHPGHIPDVLHGFLLNLETSFDCRLLDAAAPSSPAGIFARLQLYLSYSVALLWHPPILTYWDLWPLVGSFAAAYSAGCFVLFRLFLPRGFSAAGALLVTLSPVALTLVLSFRDYSKAPFFIWAFVFLICAIRSARWSTSSYYAVAAGIVAGLGVGFRADLIIIVPVGVLSLAAVTKWRDLGPRAIAIAAFSATSILFAWPVFSVSTGSSFGSVMMQGMSDPFQKFLGLGQTSYSLGGRYSDELVFSSIAATERLNLPNWDQNESEAVYGVSQAMKLSGQNVLTWMPLFVGDLATQGLKSLAWLTALPAQHAGNRPTDPSFGTMTSSPAAIPGKLLYLLLGHQWLVLAGLVGIAAFALRELTLRPRYFFGTAVLIGLVAASTATQFAVRHVFYLEFIWIISLASIALAIRDRHLMHALVRPFSLWTAGLLIICGMTYAGALFYQQGALKGALLSLLNGPRELIFVAEPKRGDNTATSLVIDIKVPDEHAQIEVAKHDSMNDEIPLIGLQWDVRAEADRLLLSLTDCPEPAYAVELGYSKSPKVWQPFDQTIPLEINGAEGSTQLLFPAFYSPTQHLAQLSISPSPFDCTVSLERLDGKSPLPMLLISELPPNWEQTQLYRSFGGFGAIDW